MARNAALPILTAEPSLTHYLEEIRRFPMLERREEYMLAKRWREHGDRNAAHKLVTGHLRLVTKIARDYRGYGLPISEAISEGNVGLMQAVERFEPEKGFRLATYAVWWIKAKIQEYILHRLEFMEILDFLGVDMRRCFIVNNRAERKRGAALWLPSTSSECYRSH
jgi:RNA polymerase sigma-32 factor